jgi:hypothetical protein
MPYDFELEWLLNNTTKTFITSSPVNYFVFTSKLNGQSIIIPAGGYVKDGNTKNKGIACFIMSRTSRTPNAEVRLNAAYVNNAISENINVITKYYGINIRPIKTR